MRGPVSIALRGFVLGCLTLVAVAALGAVLAPAARAECEQTRWQIRWVPDLFGDTGGQLVRVPVCYGGTPTTKPPKEERKQHAKPKQPTRSQLRALRFSPSEAVSATVRRRMIEQLAHGEQADAIRAQIGSGDLMRQFHANMRRQHAGSTRDLGDVYSFAYTQFWLVANDKHKVSARIDKAVRKDLHRQLALDRKVRRADDAEQQEIAEWLGSWTVVLIGSLQHVDTLGDPALVEEFRDNLRKRVSSPDLLGIDLADVRLTRHGIVRR